MTSKVLTTFAALLMFLRLEGQQTIPVQGKIIDSDQGVAVAFAAVRVNDQAAYADEGGQFYLALSPADSFRISIEQIGYQSFYQVFSFIPEEGLTLRITSRPIQIEEILVTDQQRQVVPQSDIIRDASHQVNQPRDVGDLFREVPGFGVIRRGGYAMDPVFRSFKYEQLNLLYDGGVQVIHACPNRMDPATTHVIPEEIERIELIKGPFSVRYGPAMGAVINIATQNARVPADGGIGGSVEAGYETNGDSKFTRAVVYGGNRQFDFFVNGGLKDFGNYVDGESNTIPAAFKTYDYALKAGFNPTVNQRLQASWRQSFGRDILHAGLPMDTDEDNSSILSIDYSLRNISPLLHNLNIKAYGSHVDHVMSNQRRANFMMTEAVASVTSTTYGGKIEANLLPGRKSILYAGLDFRYIGRQGDRERLVKRNMMTGELLPEPVLFVDPIWQDAFISDGGIFLEGRFLASERWTFLGGARLDYVGSNAREPAPDFEQLYGSIEYQDMLLFSATASANFQVRPGLQLQLAFGKGTRAPNMEERYINHFTVGADPYEYVGNPDLKAESNYQTEFSATWTGERYRFGANVFYSYLTDYITAAVDTTLRRKYMPQQEPRFARRYQNIDAARQAGLELSARYEVVSHLTVSGTLAYTYAQNLDWDEPLPEVPPMAGTLGLDYQRRRWWAGVEGRFVAQQERISTAFGEAATPGFAVVNLRAGVEPVRGFTIGAAVLNLFDQAYYEHLNRVYRNMTETGRIYEPGRNVTFFVKYGF